MKTLEKTFKFWLFCCLAVLILPVLSVQANAEEITYGTVEEAVEALRDGLLERDPEIVLYVKTPAPVKESLGVDIFNEAVEHTGNPVEGDYLRFHCHRVSIPMQWMQYGDTCSVTISYNIEYFATKKQEAALTTVYEQTMQGLALDGKSDYEKVKTIYDYITDNITYDHANRYNESYLPKHSAYAALVNKTSVCQGYANLFYRMALDAGVDCRIVDGIGNGGAHAWNIVKLNGKYYNVDATWDAGRDPYDYFLVSDKEFDDHTRSENYASESFYAAYPMSGTSWSGESAPVEIKTQPKNAYAKSGASAKVTFEAVGDGLKYTWYYKDPGKTKFSKSTTTGAVYKLTMNETRNGRQVYCKIKDKYGNTVKTDTVYLRMSATVTTQPTDAFAKSGSYAKLSVSAVGDGLKYEWYFKDPGKTSYTKSTTTGTTYKLMMNEVRSGRQVYCKITDKYKKYVKTDVVTLHMSATITTQPKSVKVTEGSKAKVSVGAIGDGLEYTWYFKDPGKTKFTKSTVKSKKYSVTMTSARSGRQVYCKITDQYGKTAKSETVTLYKAKIYLNSSGTKYHYDKECAGKTAYESTYNTAVSKGRTPCAKCVR